jgi:hypothetical protein
VLGTIAALAMIREKSALDQWWKLAGIFSGGTLGLFLLGMFARRAGNVAALAGTAVGVLIILWMSLSPDWKGPLAAYKSPFHSFLTIVFGTAAILLVGFLFAQGVGRPHLFLARWPRRRGSVAPKRVRVILNVFSFFNGGARKRAAATHAQAEEDAIIASVTRLSLEDAEREADHYLADPSRFRIEAGDAPLDDAYDPVLQQFFRRYPRVVSVRSQVEVEGGERVQSQADPTLAAIGFYAEHVEIDSVTGSDEVVVLDTEARLEVLFRFPTVYHLICFLGRTEEA